MKKIALCISAIAISLIMTLAAGCSIFQIGGGGSGATPSMMAAENVVINKVAETDRQLKTRVNVVKEVKRSVVAIKGIEGDTNAGVFSSGVIVDIDRFDEQDNLVDGENEFFIVTCHHCVETVEDITVYLVDEKGNNYIDNGYNTAYAFTGRIGGTPANAGAVSLVGGDPDSDLALLRLTVSSDAVAETIVEAKVMDTEKFKLELGEDVVAIGNPTGYLPGSVSAGIVSYIGRDELVEVVGEMELIQIDVLTNPGSSGGGLFNMYGELVGITNAGKNAYQGINFAIPLVTEAENQGVESVIRQLAGTVTANNYGYVSGRWNLGVTVEEDEEGVKVTAVKSGGLADVAGIKAGNYITKISIGSSSYDVSSLAGYYGVLSKIKTQATLGSTLNITVNSFVRKSISLTQYIFCDTGVK